MENIENILSRVLGIYVKYGVKSVTMDDISTELGISKKTLYQHFKNKDDLVLRTMQYYIDNEREGITEIISATENAIDELLQICRFVTQTLKDRNTSLMYDLKKYHSESYHIFREHKREFAYSNIIENINKGIAQGLYSDDFNVEVIAKFYMARVEAIIDPELFPFDKYPLSHVITEMFKYHIRGIASRKGLDYLEKINPNESHNEI